MMREGNFAVMTGARVNLLGLQVRRNKRRHYLGRVFATIASLMLELPIYDTQCGAKFFSDTPALRAALKDPFNSPWAFDVELIGRLLVSEPASISLSRDQFLEVPLKEWTDVEGSKLGSSSMLKAGLDLFWIGALIRKRRNRGD
jgi:hypothetical protein